MWNPWWKLPAPGYDFVWANHSFPALARRKSKHRHRTKILGFSVGNIRKYSGEIGCCGFRTSDKKPAIWKSCPFGQVGAAPNPKKDSI